MYKDNIPPELAETCRWSPYGEGKRGITGWNSPENWKTLDEVPGDAFFTLTDTSFLLIDGDKILGEDGRMIPEAWNDLQRIYKAGGATYCEKSVSGRGVHMVYDLGDYADSFQGLHNKWAYIEYRNHPYMEAKGTVIKAKYPKLEFFFKAKQGVYFTGNRQGDQERVVSGESAAAALREIQQMLKEHQADPEASSGKVVDKEELKITDEEKARVLKALDMIPCKDLNYDTWIQIGIAIYNCGFPFEVFDDWSKKDNKKYNESKNHTTEKKWKSFQSSPSMWNAGTIFNLAKDYGWQQHKETLKEEPTAQDQDEDDGIVCMDDVEEVDQKWITYGYMPECEMIALGSDGGIGKTTIWCNIIASLSSGKPSIFDQALNIPDSFADRDPMKILIFSGEAQADKDLKRKLRLSGANMKNIYVIDLKQKQLLEYKFSSPKLEAVINKYKPNVVVFDPIQTFISKSVRMAERNQMRDEFTHLSVLCARLNITAILIAHTNKREAAWGRDKLADSSDFWDQCRSVIMLGKTTEKNSKGEDIRFISHEKANNSARQKTILFTTPDGVARFEGVTDKSGEELAAERRNLMKGEKGSPKLDEAIQFILDTLEEAPDNAMLVKELEKSSEANGISKASHKRAKEQLKRDGKVKYWQSGNKKDEKVWHVRLVNNGDNNTNYDIHSLEI